MNSASVGMKLLITAANDNRQFLHAQKLAGIASSYFAKPLVKKLCRDAAFVVCIGSYYTQAWYYVRLTSVIDDFEHFFGQGSLHTSEKLQIVGV